MAKSENELNEIEERFYTRKIYLENTNEIKYCQDNQIIIELKLEFNDSSKIKEKLTLLKKKINSVKKEMGLNWFDNCILLLKRCDKLEEYKWYLEG